MYKSWMKRDPRLGVTRVMMSQVGKDTCWERSLTLKLTQASFRPDKKNDNLGIILRKEFGQLSVCPVAGVRSRQEVGPFRSHRKSHDTGKRGQLICTCKIVTIIVSIQIRIKEQAREMIYRY